MKIKKIKWRILTAAIIASTLLTSSYFVLATETADTKQNTQKYNWLICIANYKNHCVNSICLTSNERHCNSQCLKGAVNKCKLESEKPTDSTSY